MMIKVTKKLIIKPGSSFSDCYIYYNKGSNTTQKAYFLTNIIEDKKVLLYLLKLK